MLSYMLDSWWLMYDLYNAESGLPNVKESAFASQFQHMLAESMLPFSEIDHWVHLRCFTVCSSSHRNKICLQASRS